MVPAPVIDALARKKREKHPALERLRNDHADP